MASIETARWRPSPAPPLSLPPPCIPLPGCPVLARPVPAGFPSPATDYFESRLSLDEHLIEHQEATYFVRVQGNSMTGFGIHDGDLLVVDRALDPADRSVVIAVVAGSFTVKQLFRISEGGGGAARAERYGHGPAGPLLDRPGQYPAHAGDGPDQWNLGTGYAAFGGGRNRERLEDEAGEDVAGVYDVLGAGAGMCLLGCNAI